MNPNPLMRKEGRHSPLRLILLGVVGLGLVLVLLHSLREPQSQSKPSGSQPHSLIVSGWVVDDTTGEPVVADVYLDGRRVLEGVREFELEVPNGSEIRVEAPGYHPWALRMRYKVGEEKLLRGPVRLKRKEVKK